MTSLKRYVFMKLMSTQFLGSVLCQTLRECLVRMNSLNCPTMNSMNVSEWLSINGRNRFKKAEMQPNTNKYFTLMTMSSSNVSSGSRNTLRNEAVLAAVGRLPKTEGYFGKYRTG